MADIHIADFHRDCASILALLYRSFPRKIQLFVDDIAGPAEPDEFGLPSPRHNACFSTMLWLADAQYLSYHSPIRQEALDQVTLTHMSFILLSSPAQIPQLDNGGHTHIDNIRQALKSGASSQLQSAILHLFEQSMRYR
ncbi:hypothetical protein [Halioxenophilus sp. WMMB6]|uniref:hypothetical protein n=1 Tax=Halioxenophilus sp. WMMB6 TaxID=3073815 RepID=UPI00295EB129|nr:hypothetical protein [Halioxenophilus sp. WMMB6]